MLKTRKRPGHQESDICRYLWTYFFYQYRPFKDSYLRFEVKQTSKIQQAILKAEGNKRGTSDVFIACPNHEFAGLWLEVKTKTGRATDNQVNFQKVMCDNGYDCAFGYGLDECKKIIDKYMKTVLIMPHILPMPT